eukprot:m.229905 g.229905  ORF g.229905 m.229905 type:complete len:232 (-) comp17868_c0_seq1:35-730(-)
MSSRWIPIESNPEVMNKFVAGLGVESEYAFCDVFGFDPELLAMVPQPVLATLLLFPCTTNQDAAKRAQIAKLQAEGYVPHPTAFFLRQTIGNACGTIGIIHALANNVDKINIGEGSLKSFLTRTAGLSPEERGQALEQSDAITAGHQAAAQDGQSAAPAADEEVLLHFICFTRVDGRLLEFDGTKPFPIDHGATSEATLLEDSVRVAQQFMAVDPDNLNFTLVALALRQDE